MTLDALYPDHLREQLKRADSALERGGYDHLLIPSGEEIYAFLDDQTYPYRANPHFLSWLPLTRNPGCWIVYTPGRKPKLVYFQPEDYWHVAPTAPTGYWVEHFELIVIRVPEQAAEHLPPAAKSAILGEANAGIGEHQPNNPEALLNYLHYQRARKTAYEVELMRMASRRAAKGHLAAEEAFYDGCSEHEIHLRYCAAVGETEAQLPYANIVALNENAAILHYHHTPGPAPTHSRSFLLDAGARESGYASDITRTHASHEGLFAELVQQVDHMQLALVGEMRAGRDYRDLHLDCHRRIAHILHETRLVRMTPEEQLASDVTSTFFPHGLGHFLGIQVHDVGGFQLDDRGGSIPRPPGHPFLRLTRTLEAGHVLTVEPGLYFIPMLLDKLKATPAASAIDWRLIDVLLPFGGIRIEDDVHVTAGDPENLTRDAFAQMAA
jgi:Xaa-Pro dipeptidase